MKSASRTISRFLGVAAGLAVVAASVIATPAVLASVAAASAGILVATLSAQPAPAAPVVETVKVVQVVEVPTVKVFELDNGAGVVVFRRVDGKLTSRLYRSKVSA